MRGCRGIIMAPTYLELVPMPGPVMNKHLQSILITFNPHPPVSMVPILRAPFCRQGN